MQLGQQLNEMKEQFGNLIADVLSTGEAVGKMGNIDGEHNRRGGIKPKRSAGFHSPAIG